MPRLLIVGEIHDCADCINREVKLIQARGSQFSDMSLEYLTDVGRNAKILEKLETHLNDYHEILASPKGEYSKKEIPTWRHWLLLHKPVFETALGIGLSVLPIRTMEDVASSVEELAKMSIRGHISIVGNAYAEVFNQNRDMIGLLYYSVLPSYCSAV